jgi:AraC-like DNA-binding protein
MRGDPFSDFLGLMEARSVLSGGFAASGAWALHFPPPEEIKFCVVARGECEFRLDGETQVVRARAGDVALLPGRSGFTVASRLSTRPTEAETFFAEKNLRFPQFGDGSEFLALAGGASLHPSSAALLTGALPPLIHVSGSSPRAASLRWIIEQLVEERGSTLPGTSIASAQLAQLLFTQILRVYLLSAEAKPAGWLRVVSDEKLVPALRLMHADPARDWKLAELAKAAGMSRTSFAVHFREVAGLAPLAYLAEWRMQLAQRTLRNDDASVCEIAGSLGYRSESAFSQAFKRVTGSRPRDYRNAMKM